MRCNAVAITSNGARSSRPAISSAAVPARTHCTRCCRGNGLGPDVEADGPTPRRAMRNVVGEHRRGDVVGWPGMAGNHLVRQPLPLLAPEKNPAFRSLCSERIERGLMRTLVKELRQSLL